MTFWNLGKQHKEKIFLKEGENAVIEVEPYVTSPYSNLYGESRSSTLKWIPVVVFYALSNSSVLGIYIAYIQARRSNELGFDE